MLSVRKFLLETRGYRVLAVTTPAEALEHLQNAMPGAIDLLLADLLLPLMDGNELTDLDSGRCDDFIDLRRHFQRYSLEQRAVDRAAPSGAR